MCLSKVFMGEKAEDKIIIEEALRVVENNGTVEVYSIFGEVSKEEDCYIKEVDLENNYILLSRKEG
ncbi:MAG: CooT family nickel-binding protein [Actinobacteria bacterium]|nr:CooT family nickel-binding protein [Actinomycetota bacterium]